MDRTLIDDVICGHCIVLYPGCEDIDIRCIMPADHEGPHTNGDGSNWDDEDNHWYDE